MMIHKTKDKTIDFLVRGDYCLLQEDWSQLH